jgi:3-deoxy-7-phosphoheptulonate synthase
MIIKLLSHTPELEISHLENWLNQQEVEFKRLDLPKQSVIITSAQYKSSYYASHLSNFKSIEEIIETGTEYQLCTRKYQSTNTVVDLGDGITFGSDRTVLMAGPCAVESEIQIMQTAEFLCKNFNVKVLRAGAFKPRTSPYSFQGLTEHGLRLLEKVREQFGLKIITEVKDTTHLDMVADIADIVQIGTKAMYNFSLLTFCGKLNKPILLKRGFMSTIKEFLQAADFILVNGNPNVILCERGIRTFEPQTRFSLDVCSAALLKEVSHLPLVLDPSHAIGLAAQVPEVAQAAAALGVDGLLIEIHPNPSQAKSDREQALSFTQFNKMVPVLKNICIAVNRVLVA